MIKGPVKVDDMLIYFNTFYEIDVRNALTVLQQCGKIWVDVHQGMVYLRPKDSLEKSSTGRRPYKRRVRKK